MSFPNVFPIGGTFETDTLVTNAQDGRSEKAISLENAAFNWLSIEIKTLRKAPNH